MICPQCGAALDEDSKFCVSCGHKLEEVSVPEEAAVPQQETEEAAAPETLDQEVAAEENPTPAEGQVKAASEKVKGFMKGAAAKAKGFKINFGFIVGTLLIIVGIVRIFTAGTTLYSTSFGGDFYTYAYRGIVAISDIMASIQVSLGWVIVAIGAAIDVFSLRR